MIQVQLIAKETGECLHRAGWLSWSYLPSLGERFREGGAEYYVSDREWGVRSGFGGAPDWHTQCVTLYLSKAPPKGPMIGSTDPLP